MKTKIFMSCLLATSLMATSCQDFLQEDPKGKLTSENYYSTLDELKMSNYALYYQANQTHIFSNMVYPQVQGDDVTANPGGNKQAVADIDGFRATSDNKGVKDCWNRHYSLIRAANSIILNASRVPTVDDNQKTEVARIKAQAQFWRAYAYFTLVRLYGPLVWNEDNVNDDFTSKPLSVADIYDKIVEDLVACENVLPDTYEGYGSPAFMNGQSIFVTAAAAKSTLSAVYMAMAGFPLNKGDEYYALAADKAGEVLDNVSKYKLAFDWEWKDVYSMENNYNSETVLGLNFSPLMEWGHDSQFTSCGLFESAGGWGDFWGELEFWKNFPVGPRKDAVYNPKIVKPIKSKDAEGKEVVEYTEPYDWYHFYTKDLIDKDLEVLRKTDEYKDATDDKKAEMEKAITDKLGTPYFPENHPMISVYTINWDPKTKQNLSGPYDYRLPASENMTNDHRHRLIRLSEVYLWYAEATARAGRDLTKARNYLKMVRTRGVGGTSVDGTNYNPNDIDVIDGVHIDNMSNEQLADAAWKEHGFEVAGYMLALVTRRSDQLRMNDLKNTFEKRKADTGITIEANGETLTIKEGVKVSGSWTDDMNYLPYPDTEQAKNEHLRNVDRFADKID